MYDDFRFQDNVKIDCPKCGEEGNVEIVKTDSSETTVAYFWKCHECDTTWTNLYEYIGVIDVCTPNVLFNIHFSHLEDSYIIGRVLANNIEDAQDFLIKEFIDPTFHRDVEYIDDFGIMWSSRMPDECLDELKETGEEIPDGAEENPMILCENCYVPCDGASLTLSEIQDYGPSDLSFRLVTGEDMFFDITE